MLRRLLDSSAFAVAERLSRLRARAGVATEQSIVSKDEIRRALEDAGGLVELGRDVSPSAARLRPDRRRWSRGGRRPRDASG